LLRSLPMKRLVSLALLGAAAALLAGCPVYSDDSYYPPSGSGGTWISEDAGTPPLVDATTASSCAQPGNCPEGYTCAVSGVCELGDCSVTGCVSGYVCELESGTLQCVSTTAPPPEDAGPSQDSGDTGLACQSNADCTSSSICLDGACVPPASQCYDGTQCPVGDRCVQGACTPSCQVSEDGGSSSCPTGYSCTAIDDASTSGVCTGNPTPCESDPSECAAGTVCAQNHCVPGCNTSDTCPTGEQCVQGGCVPSQVPLPPTCSTTGVQDLCDPGSICLDYNCYISCNPDAGAAACQSAAQFNVCKPVTSSGSTYYVCGSSTSLGTECDPTSGQLCASSTAVCIDGYCY
jgi:hypothetical protein